MVLGVHALCQILICSLDFGILCTSRSFSGPQLYQLKVPFFIQGFPLQDADLRVGSNSQKRLIDSPLWQIYAPMTYDDDDDDDVILGHGHILVCMQY